MSKTKFYPVLQAILAAILFGVSAPLSKVLLGSIDPVPLAAFLYLGSGIGLFLFQSVRRAVLKNKADEASLSKRDIPWLIGAVAFGGIIAPIVLMFSLQRTPASTASLLLNFEAAATALIALLFFKENIGGRIAAAVGSITLSSILLTWDFSGRRGISIGALGVIFACICWGIDNNLTRNISSKNPFTIVAIKGIGAGLFSLILALLLKSALPDFKVVLAAMLLGFFSYGLSIVLFVYAMRNLGSARTSAFFGTAPFIGAILSFLIYKSAPGTMFLIALPLMILGAILLLRDNHRHFHLHKPVMHEHKHTHDDEHHNHNHNHNYVQGNTADSASAGGAHSHMHEHEALEHTHRHMPDTHHRHSHK